MKKVEYFKNLALKKARVLHGKEFRMKETSWGTLVNIELRSNYSLPHPHNNMKKLYPIYKRLKTTVACCPICGEVLSGNNSYAAPWKCGCGIWVGSWENPGEYKIKPEMCLNCGNDMELIKPHTWHCRCMPEEVNVSIG